MQNDYYKRLVNISVTSIITIYVCVVKTFKIYSVSNFKGYNTILLTMVNTEPRFVCLLPKKPIIERQRLVQGKSVIQELVA